MTQNERSTDEAIAKYRAEVRAAGRSQRLAGFGLVILGVALVWLAPQAGSAEPNVVWAGYAALAAGWALMLVAIFIRTRYQRRRMREMN